MFTYLTDMLNTFMGNLLNKTFIFKMKKYEALSTSAISNEISLFTGCYIFYLSHRLLTHL